MSQNQRPKHLVTKYHISPFPDRIDRILKCDKYDRCNLSICSTCVYRKAVKYREKLAGILKNSHEFNSLLDKPVQLYRVILTLKASESLRPQLNRLYECFTRFREKTLFKKTVFGGCYRLHVGFNRATKKWTPHFDCIWESRSAKKEEFSKGWHKVTGDSYVIDWEPVRLNEQSFEALSKYVLKIPFFDFRIKKAADVEQNAEPLLIYDAAARSRRKIGFFGVWSNQQKNHRTK